MGKHVWFGAFVVAVLSLTAATNVAKAAHTTKSHVIEYCGDDFCHRHEVARDCHDTGKRPGEKIMYQRDRRTCYCICP